MWKIGRKRSNRDKRIISVTTNEEFKKLMSEHGLTQADVSKMLKIPLGTVKNYTRITNRSKLPPVVLIALRLSIAARDQAE